jgi:hypothetical protein
MNGMLLVMKKRETERMLGDSDIHMIDGIARIGTEQLRKKLDLPLKEFLCVIKRFRLYSSYSDLHPPVYTGGEKS